MPNSAAACRYFVGCGAAIRSEMAQHPRALGLQHLKKLSILCIFIAAFTIIRFQLCFCLLFRGIVGKTTATLLLWFFFRTAFEI